MSQLISNLKEKEEIEHICKDNSLNIALLKDLFVLSSKGYNNAELAQKLGIHRITVQRYSQALRNMDREDHVRLLRYILREGV